LLYEEMTLADKHRKTVVPVIFDDFRFPNPTEMDVRLQSLSAAPGDWHGIKWDVTQHWEAEKELVRCLKGKRAGGLAAELCDPFGRDDPGAAMESPARFAPRLDEPGGPFIAYIGDAGKKMAWTLHLLLSQVSVPLFLDLNPECLDAGGKKKGQQVADVVKNRSCLAVIVACLRGPCTPNSQCTLLERPVVDALSSHPVVPLLPQKPMLPSPPCLPASLTEEVHVLYTADNLPLALKELIRKIFAIEKSQGKAGGRKRGP
jgi:hypothetical protein